MLRKAYTVRNYTYIIPITHMPHHLINEFFCAIYYFAPKSKQIIFYRENQNMSRNRNKYVYK